MSRLSRIPHVVYNPIDQNYYKINKRNYMIKTGLCKKKLNPAPLKNSSPVKIQMELMKVKNDYQVKTGVRGV